MIFKKTKLCVNDTSGFLLSRVFHPYSKCNFINTYGFVFASIRDVYSKLKGFVGKKRRFFVLHTTKTLCLLDNTNIRFFDNNAVPLKKRTSILGAFTKGPVFYSMGRRKILTSFSTTL